MDRPGSGIRRLTGLLLVLNLGVLVGGLGISNWPAQVVSTLEFNGDKVKFQRGPDDNGLASVRAKATAPVDTTPVATTEAVDAKAPASACLSWRSLDADGLVAVEARLKQAGISPGDYELQLDKRLGWWVYLPPFANAEAVRAAMEDARAKGVSDMAPVRSGKMANALSLGAFPNLEKARAQATNLTGKGIKGVKFGPRPEAGEVRMLFSGTKPKLSSEAQLQNLLENWPQNLRPNLCGGTEAP